MTPQSLTQIATLRAFTIFRIVFGLVWLIDGVMKFVWLQASDVVNLVTNSGSGQPNWLSGWYSFWTNSVTSAPATYLYGIGAVEVLLGLGLIVGFLRKITYFAGIILSVMIWAIDEGFGGPYGPGSTDIGAAIMYVFVFVAIMLLERSADYSRFSLDSLIERKFNGWNQLSEFW